MPVSRRRGRPSKGPHSLSWLGAAFVLAAASVSSGYWIGADAAPSELDASRVSAQAAKVAEEQAFRSAHAAAYDRGFEAGRESGRREGTEAGARDGQAEAERVLAEAAAAREAEEAARAEREAAASRARQRARPTGCSVPLFVDGYCPTPEELQQENDAESLCGPGTEEGRAEARRRGITC